MRLDVEAAAPRASRSAWRGRWVSTLTEAAWGIHRVVNENMAAAARVHGIERGKDLRALSRSSPSAARGRCTPGRSAASCACRACSCPSGRAPSRPTGSWPRRSPSTSCAPRRSAWPRRTGRRSTASSRRWKRRAAHPRAAPGVADGDVTVRRSAEMRYWARATRWTSRSRRAARPRQPGGDHRVVRGRLPARSTAGPAQGVPLEALNWRARRLRPAAGPHDLRRGARPAPRPRRRRRSTAPRTSRRRGGYVRTPVYDRYALGPGRAPRRAGHRRGAGVDHRHRPRRARSRWTRSGT